MARILELMVEVQLPDGIQGLVIVSNQTRMF